MAILVYTGVGLLPIIITCLEGCTSRKRATDVSHSSVKTMGSGTLCIPGQVWHSMVLTCVFRLADRRVALFLSCATETETTLVPLWKTPGFPPQIRLPSTTNMIPVPETR